MISKFSYKALLLFSLFVCLGFVASAQEKETPSTERPDKFAAYPGGEDKFYSYVKQNVKYPDAARRDSVTGVVYVGFMLDKNGEIVKESVSIIQGLSKECDEEAIRLIRNAPKWNAAMTKTEAIEQHISFPVRFTFE